MRSEHGLSTTLHCLQWYKLVLRTRLSTPAVQCPVLTVRIVFVRVFSSLLARLLMNRCTQLDEILSEHVRRQPLDPIEFQGQRSRSFFFVSRPKVPQNVFLYEQVLCRLCFYPTRTK